MTSSGGDKEQRPTPRTDAASDFFWASAEGYMKGAEDLCRQLERELAEANGKLRQLAGENLRVSAARPSLATPNETASEFVSFLKDCNALVAEGPQHPYKKRTIIIEVWDESPEDGGESVGGLNFTLDPKESADLLAALSPLAQKDNAPLVRSFEAALALYWSKDGSPSVSDARLKQLWANVEEKRHDLLAAVANAPSHSATRISMAALVDRFLSWKLPPSVRPDECVLDQKYPHRTGTNLLTADEAMQMLQHVVKELGCDCDNPRQCWEPCGELGHSEEHVRVAPDDIARSAIGDKQP